MSLRVLVVTAALLGTAAPAVAQVKANVDKPTDTVAAISPARLTLENAAPLPVPPPPKLRTPGAVKAPPRFVPPQPIEPPPLPEIGVLDPVPPPPPVVGAPSVQTTARPAEPKPIPPPTAAPKPAPAPSTQTAAIPAPPPPAAPPRGALSVVFDGAATDLPETAEAGIAEMAERMRANENLRLQLRSYASGTPETAREARQLSLARALALREKLTALGIRSTRVDIRALGTGTADGPPDRIDAEFVN
ncbi:MAG TPA: OmpA family protein [Azospirillum sp.]|nr:OmpA family protein [Azospirillum sp.]